MVDISNLIFNKIFKIALKYVLFDLDSTVLTILISYMC